MDKTLNTAAGAAVPAHQEQKSSTESKCPVAGGARRPTAPTNAGWWPNQLNLKMLHQHSPRPIRWTRSSIIEKNSRASTWMP